MYERGIEAFLAVAMSQTLGIADMRHLRYFLSVFDEAIMKNDMYNYRINYIYRG